MKHALPVLLCLPLIALAHGGEIARPSSLASNDAAVTATITIGNFTFVPNALEVSAGTKLIWVNQDDVPHTVIGTDGASPIKSQPLDTDDRYSVAIAKPGTYKYFCSLHPHMVGTIIVR